MAEEPLDEQRWSAPQLAAQMQGIHSNSVLHYFAASQFFDPTSNNAIVISQANFNPTMFQVIQTREAMEGFLKTMSGLEFMVAQTPAEMAPGTGTGVWVIRKQTRRKRPPEEDEIKVHNTYYIVGENIYMAPTVADILGNRILFVLCSLNKFVSTAATLPDFSPPLGHTYMPPSKSKSLKPNESQLGQASKENTPLPDGLQGPKKAAISTDSSAYLSNRLLEETLNITMKYGDEYMDENPITGAPGEFHLSSTGRKEQSRLMVPATAKGLQMPGKAPPVPTPLKTDIPPERKGNKSEKSPKTPGGGKPKRRKSKIGVVSPT